jgi:hypothetical protein
MERLQREFAKAQFVKAFNSVGNTLMVNPSFAGGKPACYLRQRRDREADRIGILTSSGDFDTAQGQAARAIEPLCMPGAYPASCATVVARVQAAQVRHA